MPRTEVYQLRLTSLEKAALANKAKARGVSIARMIRSDYGLLEVRDIVENIEDLVTEDPERAKALVTRDPISAGIHKEKEDPLGR